MKKLSSIIASVLLVSIVSVGCSSKTSIRSTDPEVKIYIDGEYKGVGSVQYADSKIVGSTTTVRMEKPGCAPVSNNFSRNEEFSVGACIGGVFVLVPFLWIMDYKPERTFEFNCSKVK